MKYFSMFSGIGGFELGILRSYREKNRRGKETEKNGSSEGHEEFKGINAEMGWVSKYSNNWGCEEPTCIGYSEIDKYAIKIYESHFNHKNYGDCTKIDWEEVEDFDLLVGGFPCQSFSIAGKRGGFEDSRGTLFFEIARCLKQKQPRLFILENVKGLLSHDQGKTFRTIIATLDELGYDIQWQVLNSKNFGVPQNRERVFIIGHLRGTSRPEVFPVGETNTKALRQVIGGSQGFRVYDPDGIATTQAGQAGGLGAKTGLYLARVCRKEGVYNMRETETSGTITSTMYKGIDASGRTGVKEEKKIRRLTPTECARLQGFPDDWHRVDGISDTQAYKVYGNSITTNVVEYIINKMFL